MATQGLGDVDALGGDVMQKGSTWVSARKSERVVALQAYASDPKYKKYVQQVEKCLNSFDNVHEWADCIAFLKQLLKTFQSYMQFKEIPRKLVVAKRLSQCLNPALPTGVHQRALDVYAHILAVLGSEGLKRDLALWSSGLFPFFEYAATSVKPTLLNLYETHYMPLQGGLRPIMKSFILALLPGLEEETGEFFEKVLSLLDKVSGTVSPSFFFQNIWLVMLTTPSARGTSLNFLGRRLPRLNSDEDITAIIGRDIGLMIRAFAAALEDDNLLVRRGALDLLLQSMRVDSVAVQRAQAEDRSVLMRAATGVVLRRDLSLNRRLYTWLLGPEEKSDHQIEYFKRHALELLTKTLKEEMLSPSTDYMESRPFKIFISLLDKWEVGAALTDILIYDAFRAIKTLVEANGENAEDLTMTASTLYEAVEPPIIWKHLLSHVYDELTGDGAQTEAIRILAFIVETFAQDDEIQNIHLPIVFSAILDVLAVELEITPSKMCSAAVREALKLAEKILRQIPHVALMKRPELTASLQAQSATQRPYLFACTFYGIKPTKDYLHPNRSFEVPFATTFENLTNLSEICAHDLLKEESQRLQLRECFAQTLLLIDRLVGRLSTSVTVAWDSSKWLAIILDVLEDESSNFTILDRTVSLSVALHQTKSLEPRLSIDRRSTMHKMVSRLLHYLAPSSTVYHARAVSLIWALEASTPRSHVEAIIAHTITASQTQNVEASYNAFGVLWRLTEDNLLPGFRFKVPMMIVLDTLRNDDPRLRRIGETWMRCSLKSVLDPLLFDLTDPTIRRVPTVNKQRGKELQGFVYEKEFDQRYVAHLMETLLSVVRFGGQGFVRTARVTQVKRSHHSSLAGRIEAGLSVSSETSYLDILIELLLRFLQSEPKPHLAITMGPSNAVLQSTCVDILQTIIPRGEAAAQTIETIHAAIVAKLYLSIHAGRLDIQNKLLHLLHSAISATISQETGKPPGESDVGTPDLGHQGLAASLPATTLLVQTLIDGITTSSNRPVLQHWLDFILMAIPSFQPTLHVVVTPLNECLCRQLLLCLADVQGAASSTNHVEDSISSTGDAEMVMLLSGLERLVLLSLAYTSEPSSSEDEDNVPEKATTEGTGILGYVSNVFGSDTSPTAPEEQLTARSPGYRALQEAVRVLYLIWEGMAWSPPPTWSSKDESLSLIYTRSRLRCRRVLEHFFRVQSAEVFESIIECWSKQPTGKSAAAFELLDTLLSSAQTAVHMICESISTRMSGASEKSKKQAINPNLSDAILFQFLEQYMRRLEGPLAVQVWSRFLQLAKDILGSARDFRPQTFPTLRCLIVLADKVTQTTAMEDKRIRKELQAGLDTFSKLLDTCVLWVGRSFDQGSWIRRTTREALGTNGRDSPAPREPKGEDKLESSISSLPDTPRLTISATGEMIQQINEYIAGVALPHARRFLMENDKILTACTNIVYYIVGPAVKGKARPLDVEIVIINIILEMSKLPAALKAWRPPVSELLNDNRLFSSTTPEAERWVPILKSLFEADKTALPELLSKVATSPSANIFSNREYEMLLRSLNLRRLSFVLYTGEKNQFLTSLPTIIEKLVDLLRNVTAPNVQSEVFLCVRVLLCRLSAHNLTSFWPVILTELYRIFEQVLSSLPSDGSEELQLILAASKCLDLMIALQTEEFQIHQWIFITDTVDSIYRPDDYFPEAMMDQLADLAGSLPLGESRDRPSQNGLVEQPPTATNQRPLRRPMLNHLRQLDSIRDLVPFFSSVSIVSYENVYNSGGNVDWEAVEHGLLDDMFDGRTS